MSIIEKDLLSHLDKLKIIARKNTVKNEKGQTVVTKDDPFREEPGCEFWAEISLYR